MTSTKKKGKEKMCPQDGVAGKGACCQDRGPEFDSWNPMVEEENCLLKFIL